VELAASFCIADASGLMGLMVEQLVGLFCASVIHFVLALMNQLITPPGLLARRLCEAAWAESRASRAGSARRYQPKTHA
jgi:hypothetical protein